MRPWMAAFLIVAATASAGCLLVEDSMMVPPFSAGDVFAVGHSRYVVRGLATVEYPDEATPRTVIEVDRFARETGQRLEIIRIEPTTGRLLESLQLCVHTMDDGCHDDMFESRFYRDAVLPWGFGASIFQGANLAEGDSFIRTFRLHDISIRVFYRVQAIDEKDGFRQAVIVGRTDGPENAMRGFSAYSGQFIVRSDTPFPQSWAGQVEHRSVFGIEGVERSREDLTAFSRGSSELPVVPTGTVRAVTAPGFGTLEPWSQYGFPGQDTRLKNVNTSFAPYLAYAAQAGLLGEQFPGYADMSLSRERLSETHVGPVNQTRRDVRGSLIVLDRLNQSSRYYIDRTTSKDVLGREETKVSHSKDADFPFQTTQSPGPLAPRPVVDYGDAYAFVLAHLPFATQYYGVLVATNGYASTDPRIEPRLLYDFSWWHQMDVAPGEGQGGFRRTVLIDAQNGILEEVYGPRSLFPGRLPWTVA